MATNRGYTVKHFDGTESKGRGGPSAHKAAQKRQDKKDYESFGPKQAAEARAAASKKTRGSVAKRK